MVDVENEKATFWIFRERLNKKNAGNLRYGCDGYWVLFFLKKKKIGGRGFFFF
jgi:hypothetical protein